MKRNLLVFAVTVLAVLGPPSFAQAQDNGVPDTLYLDVWPGDDVLCGPGPWDVRCNLWVTNDIPDPNIDSIAGLTIPLCFSSSNAAANATIAAGKNNTNVYPFPNLDNSIFRHMPDMITREEENWLMLYSETLMGQEWDTRLLDVGAGDRFWFSIVPTGTADQKFPGGSRLLTATMTFTVDDSTNICIDTCFWPPTGRLSFSRSDAVTYVPHIWDDYFGEEYYCFRAHSVDSLVWVQVNEDGFGDPNNLGTYPNVVFEGNLYAATANWVTGGEIWRSSDGVTWTQMNISGFGDSNNSVVYLAVEVFAGDLYAGTANHVAGGEIWSSSDGTSWTQVMIEGFGDANNTGVYPAVVFDGNLYAGTGNYLTGGEIWRSSDGITWTQVNLDGFGDPNNVDCSYFAVFDGKLYAGTRNTVTGAGIWRSSDGTNWTQVIIDGFGDSNNVETYPSAVFNGNLYAGTGNYVTGGEIWRSSDGTHWTQVSIDGFGDPNTIVAYPYLVFEGNVCVGTYNGVTGGEVWRSSDGIDWAQANCDGFGDPTNLFACANVVFGGCLYSGTFNDATGGEVWAMQGVWPVVTCPGDQTHNENGSYTASQVAAEDPDGTIASAAVSLAGTGVTNVALVNQSGLGTPNYTADVSYDVVDHCQAGGMVTVTVTDDDGATGQCAFDIFLTDNPPVITCPANATVKYCDGFVGQATATDVDGDAVTFSGDAAADGSINLTFGCGDLGVNTYTVVATDVCGAADQCQFDVTVTNAPPTILCPDDAIVTAGGFFVSTDFVVTDDCNDYSVSVTDVTPAPTAGMPGVVASHVEWQTDTNDEGVYTIELTVTDGCGLTDVCTFEVVLALEWTQLGEDGLGDPNNFRSSRACEYMGCLYIGTSNEVTGAEIWRSCDGISWHQVNINGFGDAGNIQAHNIQVFDGDLYASTENDATGGEIWRFDATDISWSQVNVEGFGDPNNLQCHVSLVFEGYMYSGTTNFSTGGEMWRTPDGVNWTQVNMDGFGNPDNFETIPYVAFQGNIYATVTNFAGGEVWRSPDGTTWSQVSVDGFGNPKNIGTVPYAVFDGHLYAGTVVFDGTGGQVWRTSDGTEWTQVSLDGFGDPNNSMTMPLVSFCGNLYAGTANYATGGEAWRSRDGITWSQVSIDGFGDPNTIGVYPEVVFDGNLYAVATNYVTGCEVWVNYGAVPPPPINVVIPNTEQCVDPGGYVCLPILLENNSTPFGGFELEVEFDYTSMTFVGAEPGELIEGFEKFTYRLLPCPSCGCCKYKILLYGQYDMPNGAENIGEPIPTTPVGEYGELVNLCFVVNNDENLRGLKIPVCWEWEGTVVNDTLVEDWECGENTFSSWSGDTLFASHLLCQFNPDICDDPSDRVQPVLIFQEGVCGQNCGGVDVCPAGPGECKRGDVNFNTLTYEVADAVLFASYFVEGLSVFRYDVAYQVCATDVNTDGRTLTLSDLVYLIRVILHDAEEIPKLPPSSEVANVIMEGGTVRTECAAPIGAILFEFDSAVNPTLLADMEMVQKGNKVLVWSRKGESFSSGEVLSFTGEAELVIVTAVDRDSRELETTITGKVAPRAFALHPAYPNPFNPLVNLSFDLPEVMNYTLRIYNVTGQLVRSYEDVGSVGLNMITWDSKDNAGVEVASGVYFYKLTAGSFSATEKMVILK